MRHLATVALGFLIALGAAGSGPPQAASRAPLPVHAVSWSEARPVVERLADSLPPTLREIPGAERAARWPGWVAARKQEALGRLARGEEDSLVNLLLFGTSFTAEPRLTRAFLSELDRQWKAGDQSAAERLARAYRRRASDLVAAASMPGGDDRARFTRSVLERQGLHLPPSDGGTAAVEYLLATVVRVQQEAAGLVRQLEAASRQPDPTAALAQRSRLFRERGVAPDSSVMTQYAVDRAIRAALERRLLSKGGVRRVGIVGPGLDFVDKQEGYDFYPPQSLQPFALMDSLARSGAGAAAVTVTTLDISPRVNGHLREAVARASRGQPYRLVLPMDSSAGWLEEAVAFWRTFGEALGPASPAPVPPGLPSLRARRVDVAPALAARLEVLDANVVYDRLDLAPPALFDLIVATNIFIYYDTFEQSLALAGVASLLRPGGLLISNDALLEIPEVPMVSASYLTVRFSPREGDGEHMVFYRKRD